MQKDDRLFYMPIEGRWRREESCLANSANPALYRIYFSLSLPPFLVALHSLQSPIVSLLCLRPTLASLCRLRSSRRRDSTAAGR